MHATNGLGQLLGADGNVLELGVLNTSLTCGLQLYEVKLRFVEIVVRIIHPFDDTRCISKVVGKFLGHCVSKII